jgi:hypothetical protein
MCPNIFLYNFSDLISCTWSSILNYFWYAYAKIHLINTIKDELPATFVSLEIIVYPAILGVNLSYRYDISAEVHMQVHYKTSVTWVLNYILECNIPKNNTFVNYVNSSARVYPQT